MAGEHVEETNLPCPAAGFVKGVLGSLHLHQERHNLQITH